MFSTQGTGKLMETSKLSQRRLFRASRMLQGVFSGIILEIRTAEQWLHANGIAEQKHKDTKKVLGKNPEIQRFNLKK